GRTGRGQVGQAEEDIAAVLRGQQVAAHAQRRRRELGAALHGVGGRRRDVHGPQRRRAVEGLHGAYAGKSGAGRAGVGPALRPDRREGDRLPGDARVGGHAQDGGTGGGSVFQTFDARAEGGRRTWDVWYSWLAEKSQDASIPVSPRGTT